jgi:deoxyribodipyrimidine photo-lyase
MARTLLWFRGKDLRLHDHPALASALAAGELVPLFGLDPHFFEPSRACALPHRMQFLLESLETLRGNVALLGSQLLLVEGRRVDVVPELARRSRVTRVAAMRWTEPFGRERDRRVATALEAQQLPFELFDGETLARPGSVRNGGGQPFSVFTPFARALRRQLEVRPSLPTPKSLPPLPDDIRHDSAAMPTLTSLGIAHNPVCSAVVRARRTRGSVSSWQAQRHAMSGTATGWT